MDTCGILSMRTPAPPQPQLNQFLMGERRILPAFAPTFRLALRLRSKPPYPHRDSDRRRPYPGGTPR